MGALFVSKALNMQTHTEVQVSKKNSTPAKIQLGKEVKAGLCHTMKWDIKEGSLSNSFYLKVPLNPETRALVVFLKKYREPAMAYTEASTGAAMALQWRLEKHLWSPIWRSTSGRKLED